LKTSFKKLVKAFYSIALLFTLNSRLSAQPGETLNFTGGEYIQAPSISFGNNWTVEAWVKPSNVGGGWYTILGQAYWNNLEGFVIAIYGGTVFVEGPQLFHIETTISANVWTHVAATYNNGMFAFYKNGQLVGVQTGTFTNSSTPFYIGNRIGNNGSGLYDFYQGNIDEIRIWNVTRSQCEIQSYMNAEIPGAATGLVANYHFNEGTANGPLNWLFGYNTLPDYSGNGYTGSLVGFGLSGSFSNWTSPGCPAQGLTSPTIPTPEINVTGNGNNITDGDITPTTTDHTDFGTALTRTFVVQSTGSGTLNVATPLLTGANASQFTVTTLPGSALAATSGTTSFVVAFTPTSAGTKSATINIYNLDCSEPVYDFVITATAVAAECLNFDGANDLITTGSNITELGNNDFTIETWIKTTGNDFGIVTCEDGNGSWFFGEKAFYVENDGTPHFVGHSCNYIHSAYPVNDGNWHHLAVVWDLQSAPNGVGKIYVDGIDRTSASTFSANYANLGTFRIGRHNDNESSQFFSGNMDELRIWNTARTQCEIQTYMNCEIPTSASGLLLNYHFNEGVINGSNTAVTTATNAASGSFNGTLTNMALTGTLSNWVSTGAVVSNYTTAAGPNVEIDVQGNATSIVDGDASPSTTDYTDFNGLTTRTFVIQNTVSGGTLNIATPYITGGNASNFSITTLPATSITGIGSTSFVVTFTTSSVGTKTAIVNISNSDCTEPLYDFVISAFPPPGEAFKFDGVNDYISATEPVFGTSDITVEAWIKPSTTAGAYLITNRTSECCVNGYWWGLGCSNGTLNLEMSDCGVASNYIALSTPSMITTGAWNHVAFVRSGLQVNLYVNGILGARLTDNSVRNFLASAGGVVNLGVWNYGPPAGWFNGYMDEVRIWNVARTQCEIQTYMNCEIPTTAANLLANYHFTQGAAGLNNSGVNTLTDASASARTGNVINSALNGTSSNWVAPGGVTTGYSVSATPTVEIDVQGNGTSIVDGDASPSTADFTDFNGLSTRTFVIQNTVSGGTLNVTPYITGSNASDFSITTLPATTIAGIGSTSIVITFTPTSLGVKSATLNISNSDCSEPVYDFAITATAVPASALDFDGTNDYVDCGNLLPASYTKEAWIKMAVGAIDYDFISGGDGISVGHALFAPNAYGNQLASGHNGAWSAVLDPTPLSFNTWYHVAVTYDAPTTTMKLYKNGILVSSNSSVAACSNNTIYLGGITNFSNHKGLMDEVRIWNTVRTQCEIQTYMNCEIPTTATGLVANYHFNQGIPSGSNTAVTTLTDAAGAHTGTLSNFALSGVSSNWVQPGAVVSGYTTTSTPTVEIDIQGNGTSIVDGDVTPSTADFTDFNGVTTRSFVIMNTVSGGTLNLGIPYLTGPNASEFSVTTLPGISVAGIGSTTMVVAFTPTSGGVKTATVNLSNSDCSEPVYDFAVTATPPAGQALLLDGNNDYIGSVPSLSLNGGFTVEFWAKRNSNTTGDFVLGQGTTSTDQGLHIGFYNFGNYFNFGFWNDDVSTPIGDLLWHHWACVYQQGYAGVDRYIYRDGILVSNNHTTGNYIGSGPITIGSTPWGATSDEFDGYLDELRIWNVPRTQCEIETYMSCEIPTTSSGLLANYHFNQGAAGVSNSTVTTLTDATGNGNNGTLNNFALNGSSSNWVTPGGITAGYTTVATPSLEIDIKGNGNSIPDGSTSTSTLNFTDFSSATTRTFVIQNTGTGVMYLGTVFITGTNGPEFTVTTIPSLSVASSGTTSMVIAFTPTSGGVKTATVNIQNNDCSEPIYDFVITATPPIGEALNFNSGNFDHVSVPYTAALDNIITGNFSFEAWVKPNPGSDRNILSKGDGSGVPGTGEYVFQVNPGNTIGFFHTANIGWWNSVGTIPNGAWSHVAVTWDGTNLSFYINGVLDSYYPSIPNTYTTGNNPFYIGRQGWNCNCNYFNGSIDEVRVWTVARTACEIQTYRNCEIPTTATGLLANYHFNQGAASLNNSTVTSVIDATGTNNGTINNMALSGSTSNWVAPAGIAAGYTVTSPPIGTIAVTGNGNPITNNSTSTSTLNFTDFGSATSRTFVIQNTGSGTLNLAKPYLTGVNASEYSVTVAPASTLAASATTSFVVAFTPTTGGARTATVNINNNDCAKPIFNYAIQGVAPPGAALNFDGVDDNVQLPSVASMSFGTGTDFTTEAWLKFTASQPNFAGIVVKADATGASWPGFQMVLVNNRLAAEIHSGTGFLGVGNGLQGTTVLNDGNWHHTAMVVSRTNSTVKLYVDGRLEASVTSSLVNMNINSTAQLLMGVDRTAAIFYSGAMDEVRIWNTARSQCQLLTYKDCEIPSTSTGLLANYHFNQGAASLYNGTVTAATDASGNSNTGSLFFFSLAGATSNWITPGAIVSGFTTTSAPAATLSVSGNGNPILAGSTTPTVSNFTDFGSNTTRTFVIQNTGSGTLYINSPFTISGGAASDFSVTTLASSSITTGTTNFVITFSPTSLGTRTAIVSINSSDCSSPNYSFVITASATPAAALDFDGVNDYVDLGNSTVLKPTAALTAEAWVYKANWPAAQPEDIISNTEAAGYAIFTSTPGVLYGYVYRNGGYGIVSTSLSAVAAGWHHVALTFDGRLSRLYLDGVLKSTDDAGATYPITYYPGNSTLLGAEPQTGSTPQSGWFLNGKLDEVRVWNVARTQCQIQTFMNCEIPTATGLAANYHFNNGIPSGTNATYSTVPDVAGSNPGTLYSFALSGSASNWTSPSQVASGFTTSSAPTTSINVTGNGNNILNGSTTPLLSNFTDFGTSYTRTFVVQNTSTGTLYVNAPYTISGANAGDFSITATASSTIGSSGSSPFAVTFIPTSLGTKTAVITINSSDCTIPNYSFVITATAVPGAALNFDANNDYAAAPVFNTLTNNITLQAKVYWNGTIANNKVIVYNGNSGSSGYGFYVTSNTNSVVAIFGGVNTYTTGCTLTPNVWTYLTMVIETNKVSFYSNGALTGTVATAVPAAPTGSFFVGSGIVFGSETFNGSIDEVLLWSRAMVQCEIAAYQNCEIATSGSSLVANYHFNQGIAGSINSTVTTLSDASGNNNNLTLYNFGLTGLTSNWISPGAVISGSTCPAFVAPEINVLGNAITILDGDNTPSTTDNTDFGNISSNANIVRTYTIQNTGSANLTISSITLSGTGASQFTVSALSPSSPIPGSSSAVFSVTFAPTGAGTATATINIANNDCDENPYDFVITGTATAAAYLSFDGSNDYINCGNILTGSYTKEAWIKIQSSTNGNNFISSGSGVTGSALWAPGLYNYSLSAGHDGAWNQVQDNAVLSLNTWYHVAVSYDAASLTMSLYKNGVLVSANNTVQPCTGSNSVSIGSFAGTFVNTGAMDEVRIWNRALCQTEIANNMNCEIPTTASGLIANYHFNQGVGYGSNTTNTLLTDASGSANTGTLVNFANTGTVSNWASTSTVTSGFSCTPIFVPEINVMSNAVTIVDGDISPSTGDNTNFGGVCINTVVVKSYTIQNTGTSNLTVSSITLSGSSASQFTVGTLTPASPIAPSGSAVFSVTFTPTSAGTKSATINIANNDCNENPYDYLITGTCNALPSVTATTSNSVICNGYTTSLSGAGADTYTWTGGVPTVTNGVTFTPSTTLAYTVVGTNTLTGCTSTNLAVQNITVNPSPTITASSINSVICYGGTASLTANGAATYTWLPGPLNGSNTPVTPTITTSYSVTGTSTSGCASINSPVVTITVNALPTVSAQTTNSVICFGYTTSLSGAGADTYTWTGGVPTVTNGVAFNPTVTQTYTVAGTNTLTGCTSTNLATQTITVEPLPTVTVNTTNSVICDGQQATLTVSGASIYTWTPGPLSGSVITPAPSTLTTYTVIGTSSAGCTSTNAAVQSISVNPIPTVSASISNTIICEGNTVTVNGSGASTYTWTGGATDGIAFAPSASSSYTVSGINSAGCTNTNVASVSVSVHPLPVIGVNITNSVICTGGQSALQGTGAVTYTWTGGISDNVAFSPTTTSSYTIEGTDANTCTNSAVATITVNALPVLNVTTTNSLGCEAETNTLTVSGANSYTWDSGATTPDIIISPTVSTTYSVAGIDLNGCSNSTQFTQSISPCPGSIIAVYTKTNVSCNGKDDGRIVVSSSVSYTSQQTTYEWSPSSACPQNTCDVIDSLKAGNYSVKIKVTYTLNNILVKTDSTVLGPITISDDNGECEVKVFNGISANNDGINDVLTIENIEEFPNNKVLIFNRWGEKVYEVKGYNNLDKSWPIPGEASKLTPNTYFYLIDLGNGKKPMKGWVELIKN
jgi:gliding motility-associated-like protein